MFKILACLVLFVCTLFQSAYNLEIRTFTNSTLEIDNGVVKMTVQEDSVSFLAIGDWGGLPIKPYKTPIQVKVASVMEKLSGPLNSRFQLALGDNFYTSGVKNVDDKRFTNTFEDVYKTTYLSNSPWFVTLGNHDHNGNALAQVEYSKKSNRWVIPSLNFSVDVYTSNGAQKLVSILMIDTIVMCGEAKTDSSNAAPKFASKLSKNKATSYFTDFESKLAAVSATSVPYILVVGHYPVYSIAEHGPTKCLVDNLRPLLHKYGVSAYISGHDHNLQHLQVTDGTTVNYILSGTGAFTMSSTKNKKKVPSNSLKYHWGGGGFEGGLATIQVSSSRMNLTFYQTITKNFTTYNPKFLYTAEIQPRSL